MTIKAGDTLPADLKLKEMGDGGPKDVTVGELTKGKRVVIFAVPGMGTLIYQAINARQFVELQSYIAIIAIGYVLLNFVIDALYVVLDPRIRHAHA